MVNGAQVGLELCLCLGGVAQGNALARPQSIGSGEAAHWEVLDASTEEVFSAKYDDSGVPYACVCVCVCRV
jgi:hypothetical protein